VDYGNINCGEKEKYMIDKSNSILDKFIDNTKRSNKYIKIIFVLIIMLLTASYPILDYAMAEEVNVSDESITNSINKVYDTRCKTVEDFLVEQGIDLGENDIVTPILDSEIIDGMDIEIKRAFDINITIKGEEGQYFGIPGTVGETLIANGIAYDDDDVISPAVDEFMRHDTGITVKVIESEEEVVKEGIKFKTNVDYDDSLALGATNVIKEGVNGEKEVKYLITYEDDEEIKREMIEEIVIKEAVNEEMVVGTKGATAMPSEGGGTIDGDTYVKMYDNVKAYAYYVEPSVNPNPIAASGNPPTRGTCAVDPRVIPLGTRLYIEGYGEAVANDTGGDIIGKTVDLYMSSTQECYNWGVRYIKVYVLE